MRDALRDYPEDVPRQEVFGDAHTMAVLAAWLFVAFVVVLVMWFGFAAVVYALWRALHWPLQIVRWIAS